VVGQPQYQPPRHTQDKPAATEDDPSNNPRQPSTVLNRLDPGRLGPQRDSQLLWLDTDQALLDCPEFRPYFLLFGRSQEAFFKSYVAAHVKMSELGARFYVAKGIKLN
jgi:hypothetical protein